MNGAVKIGKVNVIMYVLLAIAVQLRAFSFGIVASSPLELFQ